MERLLYAADRLLRLEISLARWMSFKGSSCLRFAVSSLIALTTPSNPGSNASTRCSRVLGLPAFFSLTDLDCSFPFMTRLCSLTFFCFQLNSVAAKLRPHRYSNFFFSFSTSLSSFSIALSRDSIPVFLRVRVCGSNCPGFPDGSDVGAGAVGCLS